MDSTINAKELRKSVVNSVKKHPLFETWLATVFYGNHRRFNDFVKEQLADRAFTDDNGLVIVNAAFYLNIDINIVGTSNSPEHPFTTIKGSDSPITTVWIAYLQDTTGIVHKTNFLFFKNY